MRTFVARTAASVTVVVALAAAGCGGGDDDETSAGGGFGEALGDGTTTSRPRVVERTTTTNAEEAAQAEAEANLRDLPELAPPAIPAESAPPTTAPGEEPGSIPIGDGSLPLWGDITVDLEPDGYLDFAVPLVQGDQVSVISAGNDGTYIHVEIWLPDGTLLGFWDDGEPESIAGWEWVAEDDLVPQTGTYVFRVIHMGGATSPFRLRFYSNP